MNALLRSISPRFMALSSASSISHLPRRSWALSLVPRSLTSSANQAVSDTSAARADDLPARCRPSRIIPMALIGDRFGPLAASDRSEAVGRRRQPVPGLAAGRDDRLVVRPDAMAELVLPQVLPHVLDRVQLGAVARQRPEFPGRGRP